MDTLRRPLSVHPIAIAAVVAGTAMGLTGFSTGCRRGSPETGSDPRLHDRLMQMAEADQQARAFMPFGPIETREQAGEFTRLVDAMAEVDHRNAAELARILDRHGWPGISRVGRDGSRAAWLVAQHATDDPPLMERALGLLEEAARQGEAEPRHWAMLLDQVRKMKGEPQVYGTQFILTDDGHPQPYAIEDRENLDTRRRSVGLPPMAEFERDVRQEFTIPPERAAVPPAAER